MGKSKKRKAKAVKRKMAALVNPQPPAVTIEGPDLDAQQIWREHVADYTHGYIEEDGRGWNPQRGYL